MKKEIGRFVTVIYHLLFYLLWPRQFGQFQILALLSLSTVAATGITSVYVPLYAKKITDSLTPRLLQSMGPTSEREIPWELVTIFAILTAFQGIGPLSLVIILQNIFWLPIGQHLQRRIQVAFFNHTHQMSVGWMMDKKLGGVLGALERGAESITAAIENILYSLIPAIISITTAIFYLSLHFGYIYAVILISQIAFYVVITLYTNEKRAVLQKLLDESEDDLRQKAMESLVNHETVKCFTTEQFEQDRYDNQWGVLSSRKFRLEALTSVQHLVQQVLVSMVMVACSLLILSSIVSGHNRGDSSLTPGDYVLCVMYLGQINGPLYYLSGFYQKMRKHIVNAHVMLMYLAEQPDIRNSPLAYPLLVREGAVEFKDVCWANDAGQVILQDVSFTITPKTTVALVGSTGSGKTSIARLLLRLMEPCIGQVLIDGINIRAVTVDSVRRAVGIIPQDTTLFDDTIRNNIRYGKPKANDQQVRLAASLAQIHERIMVFPDGYDTMVGERGAQLSGGERQRVAIARALVKNSKILIFDEASSALDSETERRLNNTLRNTVCRNRTCLMITHNLAFTVFADNIIVLKDGRVVEKGRHVDLMKKDSHFAAMWRKQRQSPGDNKVGLHLRKR